MPITFNLDQRRFNRLALTALAFGFALLMIGFVTTVAATVTSQRATLWVRHTYKTADRLDQLILAIDRTESATRGYLLAPDPVRLKTRADNIATILPAFENLRAMTSDNPRQQQSLNALKSVLVANISTSNSIMAKARSGRLEAARAEFATTSKTRAVEQVRAVVKRMRAEEERLLAQRETTASNRHSQLIAILGVTGVLLLLLGAAAFWLVRRYTIDLTRTHDRLNLLNADLEGAVERRTSELQRANDEIQKFAYIVSHDLRSPLVNVMGFTAELEAANAAIGPLVDRAESEHPELVTADVRSAREDLPEAIGFIRASTQKMDRLIGAILQLSRQGRRVLTAEPIAMEPLIDDIVASLEHRLLEADATVTIERAAPGHRQRPPGRRANLLQPPRQCRQISRSRAARPPGRSRDTGRKLADFRGRGQWPRHRCARPRARLRAVPPRRRPEPAGRRHRARPCARARLSPRRRNRLHIGARPGLHVQTSASA